MMVEQMLEGKTLSEIAQQLKDTNKKVQLIYAFNGTGKTRLSREFKNQVAPKTYNDKGEFTRSNIILYYNAFTEDLFYWDNDLDSDCEPKLKIQPNAFTDWILKDQGKELEVIRHFQHYTSAKLEPSFNENYSEITFSFHRNENSQDEKIKISKGEESNFIWSIFYSLLEEVIETKNHIDDYVDENSKPFEALEYVFIDDPVSSLDENHLIQLAVDLAELIKRSEFHGRAKELKFIITTHSPIFYNVLHNIFSKGEKYCLERIDEKFLLKKQKKDSPFSYHIFLKKEIEKAAETQNLQKYHYNFMRNILEKTSTFLGYENWEELLPRMLDNNEDSKPYIERIINISSHSKYAGLEISNLSDDDKRVLTRLIHKFNEAYPFNTL